MAKNRRTALKRIARPEKLNEYYDLEICNIERNRQNLDLNTSTGKLQLIPTDRDEGFLIFLYSAQLHLKTNGFDRFYSLYQSKDAYPYIKFRRNLLVLVDEMDGEDFTYTPENIVKGLESLAEFHNAARGLNPMPGSEFKVSWGKWPDRCFQEINDLVKQKLILKDKRSERFDEGFIQQVDRLIERGLMAWQRFNHDDYRKLLKQSMEDKSFNLHSCKAEKFKIINDQVYIKDMNRIRYEVQVYDLAVFLDDILRETTLPVEEIAGYVKEYTKIRHLSEEEWQALLAFILYPKDIYRLIRHYYRRRRTREGLKRFEQLVTLLEREEELITHLERYR